MKKQKGFSLIELLIVVAIILIIAAIAIRDTAVCKFFPGLLVVSAGTVLCGPFLFSRFR